LQKDLIFPTLSLEAILILSLDEFAISLSC